MRNLKKILSLVLAMMMVLSLMVTASAADFADDASISPEYKVAVETLTGMGVINGVTVGETTEFQPQGNLNREAAAKIVAYILFGGELDEQIVDAIPNPFTDVSGWSVDVIKYCFSEGIIAGVGDNRFDPKAPLDGYAFGLMLLRAAGIDVDEYNGSTWRVKTITALRANNLMTGLGSISMSAPMTREQACQMAWNVMQYTATGSTTVYVVTGEGGAVLYRGTSAMDAYVIAQALEGTLTIESTSTGSLADTNFGLTRATTDDAFGRTSTIYTNGGTGANQVIYSSFAPTAVLTYTTATTWGAIVADLGIAVATDVTFSVYNNSNVVTSTVTADRADTAAENAVGGQGTLIQIYATGANAYKAVIVDTYAAVLGTANIIAAVPATATTAAVPAMVGIDVDGQSGIEDDEKIENTAGFKAGDVVLYTASAGKLINVSIAPYVNAAVTATSSTYVRLNGNITYKAAHNITTANTIGTSPLYSVGTTVNTYYMDGNGNIIHAVTGETASTVVYDYVYVISTAAKAASTVASDDLYGTGTTTAAVAQARIMNLTTGAISVVNQGVVQHSDGNYYYATATGAADTANEVENQAVTTTGYEKIMRYTTLANGSIVLENATLTDSVTVQQNTIAAASGLFATSTTQVTVLEYTANYASVERTTYTGIANFPATAITVNGALVLSNDTTKVINSITIVKTATAVPAPAVYGIYAGAGETTAAGTAYAFYVNGTLQNYYLASGTTASQAGFDNLATGEVATITLTGGALAASAVAEQTTGTSGSVTYVDATYAIIGGTAVTLATGYQVIDGTGTTYPVSALAAGQTVTYFTNAGAIVFAVITG